MDSYIKEVYSLLLDGNKEWADLKGESDKPAEVFDAHPISAMKVADSDFPVEEETITITDTWKPEWQRGVQVPVNPPTEFPQTVVRTIDLPSDRKRAKFDLPSRLLRCSKESGDAGCDNEVPAASHFHPVRLEEMFASVCRYDLDELDQSWIGVVNEERKCLRQRLVDDWMVEQVIESLEVLTHDKLQEAFRLNKDENHSLEYDETVLCDVCKEPDGEDGNEMVFCDGCDVCVHQACYGILNIPEGAWLCRPCSLGFKAVCTLCPKSGGALKPARDGARWCHVSCALWIPEVGFADVEKMEPITKITEIPSARWSLLCVLCRQRVGACIQCAVKTCKIAFHVTCAYQRGLKMQQVLTGNDVRMLAYCPRHSPAQPGARPLTGSPGSPRVLEADNGAVPASKPSSDLEANFHELVSLDELRTHLSSQSHSIPGDICQIIAEYWKLKRRSNNNQPLLKVSERPPVIDEEHARLVARMQMFITLRHDLERARNLCYMILKREKLKRSRFKAHEALIKAVCRRVKKQARLLTGEELTDLASLPFVPDDIYDSGLTFAARSLSYARALPEQELLTRQELARIEADSKEQRGLVMRSLPLSPVPPEAVSAGPKGRGRCVMMGPFAKPRLRPPGRPPGALGRKRKALLEEEAARRKQQELEDDDEEINVEDVDEPEPSTEWVSVEDILEQPIINPSPVSRIPRDQLLVSSAVKDRLRQGLRQAKYRGLVCPVGPTSNLVTGATPPILKETNDGSVCKNIFDRLLSSQG